MIIVGWLVLSQVSAFEEYLEFRHVDQEMAYIVSEAAMAHALAICQTEGGPKVNLEPGIEDLATNQE
jgi:hypothetical protein